MKQRATAFFCSECGNEFAKWMGKCPACSAWNSLVEAPVEPTPKKGAKAAPSGASSGGTIGYEPPVKLSSIRLAEETRFPTGFDELDRVLGGGAVAGSLCLIAGEPGIGKSTLLMQVCGSLAKRHTVLYNSGEESARQLRLRGERLGAGDLLVLAQTELEGVLEAARNADILVVDSIQTMRRNDLASAPGSVAQVRECAMSLMRLAKENGVTVFLVGHINKEGAIAGPKVLEHMVDCVLYFEGDKQLRVLRAEKNRFGSTHEIGVFEMADEGLREVPSPSETLLAGRPLNVSGTCVACVMEGSRPVLAEIQALVTPTPFPSPRRTVSGLEYNRAMLLLAVLEKRAGLYVGNQDVYLNVVGGLRMGEPAADLPALLALVSSHKDNPLPGDLVAFGEVGLAGELRSVPFIERRLSEACRLGFRTAVIPAQGTKNLIIPDGMHVARVKTLREACGAGFRG
ncbi:MAG: DNA repair protein RadA [Oscillospiraceae bacterium]|jgi:DNA repair protein RadA/Sms|nr:DNA repair protein RadA [Oscillospiraceae bacterium]